MLLQMGGRRKMKRLMLLLFLSALTTSCTVWYSRNCSYYEGDGLYYNSVDDTPCTSLNKKIERNRKK